MGRFDDLEIDLGESPSSSHTKLESKGRFENPDIDGSEDPGARGRGHVLAPEEWHLSRHNGIVTAAPFQGAPLVVAVVSDVEGTRKVLVHEPHGTEDLWIPLGTVDEQGVVLTAEGPGAQAVKNLLENPRSWEPRGFRLGYDMRCRACNARLLGLPQRKHGLCTDCAMGTGIGGKR